MSDFAFSLSPLSTCMEAGFDPSIRCYNDSLDRRRVCEIFSEFGLHGRKDKADKVREIERERANATM